MLLAVHQVHRSKSALNGNKFLIFAPLPNDERLLGNSLAD